LLNPLHQKEPIVSPTPPPLWKPLLAGDRALILEFGNTIDQSVVQNITQLNALIELQVQQGQLAGLMETIPTFRSLAIVYDPLVTDPANLLRQIEQLVQPQRGHLASVEDTRHWRIPVCYGQEHGPDLDEVSQLTGLSALDVLSLHQGTEFTVYMLGFLPGFAFLGDTPAELHLPRKQEPRVRVPAGSVAIASQLTGVYPWDSPGGWHILGNCPIPLFNGLMTPPALFKAGDRVSFNAIEPEEHAAIRAQIDAGNFKRSQLLETSSWQD